LNQPNNIQKEVVSAVSIAKESNSEELFLTDLSLTELPASVKFLKNIKTAYFIGNNFKRLPLEICALENLEKLYISDCGIEEIPEEISNLSKLTFLDLKNNKLKNLPSSFSKLSNLKTLYLNNNSIEDFPESLVSLNLNKLFLQGNNLKSLPNELSKFSELEILDVSQNQLESMPNSLGEITTLRKINLANNNISALPQSFSNLVNLDANNQKFAWNNGLNVEGNKFNLSKEDYGLEPLELIAKILNFNKPSFSFDLNIAKETYQNTTQNLPQQINILAFGENQTEVIELLENFFDFNEDYSTATAIIFDEKIHFNFFNLGFIDINAANQNLLEIPNSIKFFVVNNTENLSNFNTQSNYPQIFISNKKVKTVKDNVNFISLKSALKSPAKFENLFADCLSNLNKETTSKELLNLTEQFNNLNEIFISKEKFISVLIDFGIDKKLEQVALLKELQNKKLVYTFNNQFSFEEIFVFNKLKLIQMVQSVYNSNLLVQNNGVINFSDANKILALPKQYLSYLVNVFLKEKWAFKSSENQLIFPSLFQFKPEIENVSNTLNYSIIYRFKIPSQKIFHALIVKLSDDFFVSKLYKNFIEVEVSNSLVSFTLVNNLEWKINIEGEKYVSANKFFTIYLETFFMQNKVLFENSLQCNCQECISSQNPFYYKLEQLHKRKLLHYKTISCPQSMLDIDLSLLID